MRNARLQAQDLGRTNQFVHTLLTKEDVKDLEKPEVTEPAKTQQSQHLMNGALPFRTDAKPRFSEPPAPPPQQPLPEKPDAPSLKRGSSERPKSGPPNSSSPVRQENLNQIIHLTEALNNAKRDIDAQTARMRELEEMLQKEREARELAEDLAKRLEASASAQTNGSIFSAMDTTIDVSSEPETRDDAKGAEYSELVPEEQDVKIEESIKDVEASLQSRIDSMDEQMKDMREQLEKWKQRCDVAESERDESRKSLAEMVVQLRAEEAKRIAAEERRQSRSRRSEANSVGNPGEEETSPASASEHESSDATANKSDVAKDESDDGPTLSRANTITPLSSQRGLTSRDQSLQAGLPYASMIGVVLMGMGLMAYINGWQATPSPGSER